LIPVKITLSKWQKRGILWGVAILIPFIVQLIVVPQYLGIQFTPTFYLFLFTASVVLGIILVMIRKKKIFVGIFPIVFGSYFLIYGLAGLVGGMNVDGVSLIDLKPYSFEQQWILTDRAIIVFVAFLLGGLGILSVGIKQLLDSSVFIGWR